MSTSIRLFALIAFTLVVAAGCGAKGRPAPKTVGVSGTIYVDGQPAEGVQIFFQSEEGFIGTGKSDSSGKYELVGGAVAGTNKVYFSKFKQGSIAVDPESGIDEEQLRIAAESMAMDGNVGAAADVGGEMLAEEFLEGKSEVTYDIPDGGAEGADFRIKSRS